MLDASPELAQPGAVGHPDDLARLPGRAVRGRGGGLTEVDKGLETEAITWAFSGDQSVARTVLSVVAGPLITVAGLTFSITIVVLQPASSQSARGSCARSSEAGSLSSCASGAGRRGGARLRAARTDMGVGGLVAENTRLLAENSRLRAA